MTNFEVAIGVSVTSSLVGLVFGAMAWDYVMRRDYERCTDEFRERILRAAEKVLVAKLAELRRRDAARATLFDKATEDLDRLVGLSPGTFPKLASQNGLNPESADSGPILHTLEEG
jgi:hypothetical protein